MSVLRPVPIFDRNLPTSEETKMPIEPTEPDGEQPPVDEEVTQQQETSEKETAWRQWMMIGIGWTALLSLVAVIISIAALNSTNPRNTMVMGQQAAAVTPAAPAGRPEAVKLVIKSDTEHGKKGPDGKWHDAFLPANFKVHAGDTVTVTVYNYDDMPHSFTSSSLSSTQLINQNISEGSATAPSKTTFTFKAPSAPGRYSWWCALPCDPYAMAHVGYMRGYVTVAD
jgi:plastocyanin